IFERQRPDAIGVVSIRTAPPHPTAQFSGRTASKTRRLAKTEIVRPAFFGLGMLRLISRLDPTWVLGEILSLAVVLEVVEINRQRIPGPKCVHQTKPV